MARGPSIQLTVLSNRSRSPSSAETSLTPASSVITLARVSRRARPTPGHSLLSHQRGARRTVAPSSLSSPSLSSRVVPSIEAHTQALLESRLYIYFTPFDIPSFHLPFFRSLSPSLSFSFFFLRSPLPLPSPRTSAALRFAVAVGVARNGGK